MDRTRLWFGGTLAVVMLCSTWSWMSAQSRPFGDIIGDQKNQESGTESDSVTPLSQGSRLDAQGRVLMLDCRVKLMDEIEVACQQPGVLDFVATEGQVVTQGQLLAHTADDLLRASLAIADRQAGNDVEVRLAEKQSELKQVQYERDLQANKISPGTVSDLTLQEHRLDVERALLQLEMAKTTVAIEKLKRDETWEKLKRHGVKSRINGMVRTVFKHPGETVREGDAILELVSTERMRVEGYVHVNHLSAVRPGQTVSVRVHVPTGGAAQHQIITGRIVQVDVKVDPVAHLVKVWAEVPNRDNWLKDGHRAEMLVTPSS